MSEREAFVAAIAANPADDLPRLVFADWLDENGDPERAEFIRKHIALTRTYESGSLASSTSADIETVLARTKANRELLRRHWPKWFAVVAGGLSEPFSASDWVDVTEDNDFRLMLKGAFPVSTSTAFGYGISRGFLTDVSIVSGDDPQPLRFVDALRAEPISTLRVVLPSRLPHWNTLTDPSLRKITRLDVTGNDGRFGTSAPGLSSVFNDSHLAGVRTLAFNSNTDMTLPFHPVPSAAVADFARSPLAYRINELCIRVDDGGLRALARSDRLALHTLRLHYNHSTTNGRKALASARWRGVVERLSLGGFDSRGEPIRDVFQGGWLKLRELSLRETYPTDVDLIALADSSFAAQLEVLDLAHNAFTQWDGEVLKRLCAALNPTALRKFVLPCPPFWVVPDELKQRFGQAVSLVSE